MGLLYITDGNSVINMLGSMFLMYYAIFCRSKLLKKNKRIDVQKKLYIHRRFWIFFWY